MRGLRTYGRSFWPGLMLGLLTAFPLISSAQQDLPDKPDLIRVTVDHLDNGVLIQWEPSTDDDIRFYHLYKLNDDQSFVKLSSFSSDTFEYKHMTSGLKNLAYSVTAEDSTGSESLFEENVHRAVSATVKFDPCTPANLISWGEYRGWEDQISGYKVYGGRDGEVPYLLNFVNPGVLNYKHSGVAIDSTYHYYIETVNTSGITSLSSIETVSTRYPQAPDLLILDNVSVLDRSTVQIRFRAQINGPVNDFRLMRRNNDLSPYAEVETINDPVQSDQMVEDQVPTLGSSYEYIVQSIYHPEECSSPLVVSVSNPGTSILLVSELQDMVTALTWTPYNTYVEGLSGYVVQRKNGSGEFIDVASVGPETHLWSEPVLSVINGFQPGEIQYRVLAIENRESGEEMNLSISNVVKVNVETDLRVPNAFTPGSNDMNYEFKPIIDFAPRKYTMVIYDRAGRKLYETANPGEGWDGRFRAGDFVDEGVYVYYIQYTDYTGLFRSLTGNVTVLYP